MGEGKILEILDPSTIAFLLLAGFIAAFIDSTVGGGGLISTPALLALGLPVNFALGTNKLAASMGGLMSVFSFWRAGKINQKVAKSDAAFFSRIGFRCLCSLSSAGTADEKCDRCPFSRSCCLHLPS